MTTINLNDVCLHTRVLGGSGPLVFMCHGLVRGSMATWYFQFAPALAKRHRVVLYDMRGHGRSQRTPSGYDLDTLAADLGALVDHYRRELDAEGQPVHLVGHSYGALVALNYARKHPDHVGSMALLDAPLPASHYVWPSMAELSSEERVDEFAESVIAGLGQTGDRKRRKLVEHVKFLYLQSSLRDDVARCGDFSDESLRALTMPVLIVYGERSDCLAAGRRLSRVLVDNRFKTVAAGHFLTVEAPHAVADELNHFFGVQP